MLRVDAVQGVPEEVQELLARHRAWALTYSPSEDVHALAPAAAAATDISFFTARDGAGRLLGIGALRELDPGHGEIKSMHTVQQARGRGVARAVLQRLIATARQRGYHRLSLETGTGWAFEPARALYETAGFIPCRPFGDYGDSPHSVCLTLSLQSPPESAERAYAVDLSSGINGQLGLAPTTD